MAMFLYRNKSNKRYDTLFYVYSLCTHQIQYDGEKMKKTFLILLLLLLPCQIFAAHAVRVQVLGSGGPESGDKRASSAYLVWIDGKSRFLIDFGGGAMLRFEESGARIEDLDAILLTHLHIDHTADLPALMKASFFTDRRRDLPLYGPDRNRLMPDTATFTHRLFGEGWGAWQYMGDYLDGRAAFQLKPATIPETKTIRTIYRKGEISIRAVSVHHGPIPALAYRINIGTYAVTFSGDMNGSWHTLEKLAKQSDLLIAHHAVPKGARGVAAALHMTPLTIGEIARKAKVKKLILSHRMLRTLGREKETRSEIRKNYRGEINFAEDLESY